MRKNQVKTSFYIVLMTNALTSEHDHHSNMPINSVKHFFVSKQVVFSLNLLIQMPHYRSHSGIIFASSSINSALTRKLISLCSSTVNLSPLMQPYSKSL